LSFFLPILCYVGAGRQAGGAEVRHPCKSTRARTSPVAGQNSKLDLLHSITRVQRTGWSK
jgi:hypothetical protein